MKRLCIYFFYDKDGIVDDYIPYMLKNIRPFCEEMCFVSNGPINKGKENIAPYLTHCIERENRGFDVGAYKEALFYYGWDKLAEYDEIIMMNYTLFGPVYPFDEMFAVMDNKKELDFWGITKHHGVPFDPTECCKYKEPPAHIQSSFWCLRKNLITSQEYHNFIEELPEIKSYKEACGLYEVIFTQDFKNLGFKAETYIDTDDLEGFTWYPLMNFAPELLKNRRCPVFKVKSFSEPLCGLLRDSYWDSALKLRSFISSETDYDFNMVWQHIIRTANIFDLQKDMHLQEILPVDINFCTEIIKEKAALIIRLDYKNTIDLCLKFAENMPENSDLILVVSDKEIKNAIERKQNKNSSKQIIILNEDKHRHQLYSLIKTAGRYLQNYEYVCFIHDLNIKEKNPHGLSLNLLQKNLENCLYNKTYVSNIIYLLKNNRYLGLLSPFPSIHPYLGYNNNWQIKYEKLSELIDDLGINTLVQNDKPSQFSPENMFWFRPKALSLIINKINIIEDGNRWDLLNYILPNAAQGCLYYTSYISTTDWAKIELDIYNWIMDYQQMSQPESNIHFKELKKLFKKYLKRKLNKLFKRK